MEKSSPENKARKVIDECADCDVCRFLMDSDCLMFPELYRLYDKERETGEKITSGELRHMVDLCNFCALCPCPPVRANLINPGPTRTRMRAKAFPGEQASSVKPPEDVTPTFVKLAEAACKDNGRVFDLKTGDIR